jgi:hypothetical protein
MGMHGESFGVRSLVAAVSLFIYALQMEKA